MTSLKRRYRLHLNKIFLINTIAIGFIFLSYIIEPLHQSLLYTGLFALSGSLTNELAIYMLFEKVPFLYGSGVIELRFEEFKASIKKLMMEQFFTPQQLQNFLANEEKKIDLAPIIEQTDFSPAFDALSKTVMESSFGGMLNMFGGVNALENLKEPFSQKMKAAIITIVHSQAFEDTLHNHLQKSSVNEDMLSSIESIITNRLDQLTPQMVKEMIQNLIKEHLSWLVIWGGVFGGVIGLVSSFLV